MSGKIAKSSYFLRYCLLPESGVFHRWVNIEWITGVSVDYHLTANNGESFGKIEGGRWSEAEIDFLPKYVQKLFCRHLLSWNDLVTVRPFSISHMSSHLETSQQ